MTDWLRGHELRCRFLMSFNRDVANTRRLFSFGWMNHPDGDFVSNSTSVCRLCDDESVDRHLLANFIPRNDRRAWNRHFEINLYALSSISFLELAMMTSIPRDDWCFSTRGIDLSCCCKSFHAFNENAYRPDSAADLLHRRYYVRVSFLIIITMGVRKSFAIIGERLLSRT